MISNWWNKREKREKKMLSILAIFFLLLVGYELLSIKSIGPSKTEIWKQQRSDLLAASQLEKQIVHLKQAGAHSKRPATQASIQRSLKMSGLQPFLTATDLGNHSLSLQFDSVPFDQLSAWLTQLTQTTTVQLQNWSAKRLEKTGTVSTKITLVI